VVSFPSADVGFWHGGSAADLTGDGFPDVVAVNNASVEKLVVFVNNRDGTFTREASGRQPILSGSYFSAEMADVDQDGRVDLLLGGHEWENASTAVWLNPGTNNFRSLNPVVVPAVANEGAVVDFALTGSGSSRTLWISRTSGGDGTFYQSRVLQRFVWPTRTSSIVVQDRPGQWVPWLLPYSRAGTAYIGSDDPRTPLEVAVP
jgi:hypothetical protein